MTPGLPSPPEPPHDPRSILLNGRVGFRQAASGAEAAVVDPTSCAMMLPRLPSALRDLAEATGSLGGIRPPANVALGPDSLYLLDRTHAQLKLFDRCECRFVPVPCLGGEGRGPRQFRNPGDIAIACGNVYVADTGVEKAPPGQSCSAVPQDVEDATIRGENHRVSVFSLKGFALRGHLVPPPEERPWRPVSIAVDSLGRAWVGDKEGKLHRFTPNGTWERSWPMVPWPAHLAIDCRNRVYVIAPGTPLPLRVFDDQVRPVADPPEYPDDVRAVFPVLPSRVDDQGRLWLEPCCDQSAIRKSNANADLVFDRDGNPLEVARGAAPQVYERSAIYRSEPLDSGIAQCLWHRVVLFGALPQGTRVRVRAFGAEEKLSDAELDSIAAWRDCAVAETFDNGRQWDCLVRTEPGRYLWLELRLEGNGLATPVLGAIVVEYPRVSLRRFLPAVFGADPVSADFTDRFLSLFDTTLRSIERRIDAMAHLFDPASAPAAPADPRQQDFLSWLGTWIGISIDRNWDVATRRRVLKRSGALLDRRGTLRGLRDTLLLLLDFSGHAPCAAETRSPCRCDPVPPNCAPEPRRRTPEPPPLVLEHFRLRRWLRLGAGHLAGDAVLWGERVVKRTRLDAIGQVGVTRLDTSPDPQHDPFLVHANQFSVFVPARFRDDERLRKALESLLKAEAPANTRGYLHFVEPRFRIGQQSMLGFDAVIGAVPQGVTLGSAPLGAGSVLTSPPHLQGGPSMGVGRGRLGITARLD